MKPAIAISLFVATAAHAQHAAHEHGAAHLTLVQDGKYLSLDLKTPLGNLVGFEHKPRSDADHAALGQADQKLCEVTQVVALPVAAGCAVDNVDSTIHFDDHGHAELEVGYSFDCASPEALDVIGVKLFDAFPRLERLDAEAATARGQGAAKLTRDAPQWRLPGH